MGESSMARTYGERSYTRELGAYARPLSATSGYSSPYTCQWAANSQAAFRGRHSMDRSLEIAAAKRARDVRDKQAAEERAHRPLLGLLSANNVHEPWEERERMSALAADRNRPSQPWSGVGATAFQHADSVSVVGMDVANPGSPNGEWISEPTARRSNGATVPPYPAYSDACYGNSMRVAGGGRVPYFGR